MFTFKIKIEILLISVALILIESRLFIEYFLHTLTHIKLFICHHFFWNIAYSYIVMQHLNICESRFILLCLQIPICKTRKMC